MNAIFAVNRFVYCRGPFTFIMFESLKLIKTYSPNKKNLCATKTNLPTVEAFESKWEDRKNKLGRTPFDLYQDILL